jgi:hypothetical protein
MEYLKIQNAGELDVRLISLMGGSTKQGNTTKIGRFGTGLKYSLAYLVRNNIDFKIFVGSQQVNFEVRKEHIQNTDFDVIYINGERSSITSTMGVDWVGWMICREIFCNALDEGGLVKELTHETEGKEGTTTFYIQNVGEIKETVLNWDNYFINETPILDTPTFAIYPARERMCLYKNGVLIHKEADMRSVFSYDIKTAEINELREYKGYLTYDLFNCIRNFDKKTAELFLSLVNDNCFEGSMDYQWGGEFTKAWADAIGQGKIIARDDFDSFKKRGIEIDESEHVILPKALFQKIAHKFPHTSAVRRADKVNSFHEVIDKDCEHKINTALEMLADCGYEINPELKWITGIFGNPSVFAKINMDERVIMYSTELKQKPMFTILATIVEENEHFKTGFEDCSRNFQQHFINLFVKQLAEKRNITI